MNAATPHEQPFDPNQPQRVEIDFEAFIGELRAQLNFAQERAAINASQVAMLTRKLQASEAMVKDLTQQLGEALAKQGEAKE